MAETTGKPFVPMPKPTGIRALPKSPQTIVGDPVLGYDFLLYGDYVGSGIPYEVGIELFGGSEDDLGREGPSAGIPYSFNVFPTPNGVEVIGGITCFGCHSGNLEGERVLGLGDHASDFTRDQGATIDILERTVGTRYGRDSPEYEALEVFTRGSRVVAPYIQAPVRGVNVAVTLEAAAVVHRRPEDLSWSDEPLTDFDRKLVPTDVPPLWNVKKKPALYYNGMGRGDFSRLIQQVSVVALFDEEQYRASREFFPDVLAWLWTLEPPVYPGAIDEAAASRGEEVFGEHCARCHGTYGARAQYPGLLVELREIGTDPLYADYFVDSIRTDDWYALSPFAEGSALVPERGYIAPPLDGVWATAPYLHNASVPTLTALLNTRERPRRWRRDHDDSSYDLDAVGWPYEEVDGPMPDDFSVYDTRVPGYDNRGHIYGDILSDAQRADVLEYLKTL